ncbi:MAG: hypothetical protein NVS2B17_15820 [Candidatus Velthaea sp.]
MNEREVRMSQTFTVGRFFDIRVGVHVSWIAVYIFMTLSIASSIDAVSRSLAIGLAAVCALALFVSVVAHEFAHALVARRFGVKTTGITLFLFGGVATLEREPPSPRAEMFIALAGPAASGALAGVAFLAIMLLERTASGAWAEALGVVLAYLAIANGVLAVFNLIPAFPMDGGRVLRAALWSARKSHASATASASLTGVVFAGILFTSGIGLAIWQHSWQFGWYVLLGAFIGKQSWSQYREARLVARLERVRVADVMDAAADEMPFEGIHLESNANALDALAAFRSSDRTTIAVLRDGRLAGWLSRDRTLALLHG